MKKLFFALVSIILVISMLLTGCSSRTSISIGKGKGSSGEFVEVKIKMNNNVGLWGGQLIVDYDYANFTFVSVTNGTVFETCESNDTGENVILVLTHKVTAQSSLENTVKDGTVATLKFKIKTGVSKGKYAITINDESNFCNASEEMIDVTFGAGQIKVK